MDSIAIHVESSIQAGRKAKQDTQVRLLPLVVANSRLADPSSFKASVQGLSARMDDFNASIREAIDSITLSNEVGEYCLIRG